MRIEKKVQRRIDIQKEFEKRDGVNTEDGKNSSDSKSASEEDENLAAANNALKKQKETKDAEEPELTWWQFFEWLFKQIMPQFGTIVQKNGKKTEVKIL